MFIRVRTRRGPRARQITREGVLWLRQKYPADQFPKLEDVSLDYETYRELQELGHIYTRSGRSYERKPPLPEVRPHDVTPPVPRTGTLLSDLADAVVHPMSRDHLKQASIPLKMACPECAHASPPGARFCPRCGRALSDRKDAADFVPIMILAVIALAVIGLAIWTAKPF
jgi:hypothetical protein